jgi:polyhydroxyalkanoate synthesis regulator phasin
VKDKEEVMSAERKKVLELLAQGKISAEDAEKLLDKLAEPASAEKKAEDRSSSGPTRPRFMRIVVDKPGQEQVNIRMPLSFMRTGTHLLAVLPPRVSEKLTELGIDFSGAGAMNEKEWAEAVENMNIDIDKGNGKKVRIFCE